MRQQRLQASPGSCRSPAAAVASHSPTAAALPPPAAWRCYRYSACRDLQPCRHSRLAPCCLLDAHQLLPPAALPPSTPSQICLWGVCIPVHLLLPFLVALAHQHGFLLWLRREWFTLAWWKQRLSGSSAQPESAVPAEAVQPQCCSAAAASGNGSSGGTAGGEGQAAAGTSAGPSSDGLTRRQRGPA